MAIWQDIPLLLIVLPLLSAAICAVLPGRVARRALPCLILIGTAAEIVLLVLVRKYGGYTYALSEFGAPFGNELRVGTVEALIGTGFSLVILFSVMGGWHNLEPDISDKRVSRYVVVVLLIFAAVNALTYTNDLFTGYVFIEILTIASCALIAAREERGRAVFAATRYMIMNLLGSGLFLLGLSMLYRLTGYLHFPQIKSYIAGIASSGQSLLPVAATLLLISLGVAIKTALSPFHTWLPSAYSNATTVSSSLLSSVVSKAYLVLLIRIICLGYGLDVYRATVIPDVLLVFALVGTILGSIDALGEHNLRRMIAYSSVAQIGYIFLGISMGTRAGMTAALFHLFAHSFAKAMLFPASDHLSDVSGRSHAFRDLRGSAVRAPLAGLAFTIGACSVTGVPLLGGFTGKLFLMNATQGIGTWRTVVILAVLAISTVLNVMYLLRTIITIYRRGEHFPYERVPQPRRVLFTCAMVLSILMIFFLGLFGGQVFSALESGFDAYM